MALVKQMCAIDLTPDAARPVVKASQYDTRAREITFAVYDGSEPADLTGCTARVDGTRTDGARFSVDCAVSGSTARWLVNAEMTNQAGKHPAELVVLSGAGDVLGTQNFILDVEPAPMDRAVSAEDRTLYDQYTASTSQKVQESLDNVGARMDEVDAEVKATLEGVDDAINDTIDSKFLNDATVGAFAEYNVSGTVSFPDVSGNQQHIPLQVTKVSDNSTGVYNGASTGYMEILKGGIYQISVDYWYSQASETASRDTVIHLYRYQGGSGDDVYARTWMLSCSQGIGSSGAQGELTVGTVTFATPDDGSVYRVEMTTGGNTSASMHEAGTQITLTRLSGGTDIVRPPSIKVGTVTTGAAGSEAKVVNSGDAQNAVFDFTIPRGEQGEAGTTATDLLKIYPVGALYFSMVDTDPGSLFGGTWERIAKGRTLVGVDEADSDFAAVRAAGGEKTHTMTVDELVPHTHTYNGAPRNYVSVNPSDTTGYNGSIAQRSGSSGGGKPFNVMQPFLTVYIWERVA